MIKKLHFFLLFFLTLILSLVITGQTLGISQPSPLINIVQQGVMEYQEGNYIEAIKIWQQGLNLEETNHNLKNKVIIQENLARTYQKIGQTTKAIDYWQKAITNYQQLDNIAQVGRLLTEQAQAYSNLGQHQKAITLLCSKKNKINKLICDPHSALGIAKTYEDNQGEIAALGSLGEVYRIMENYEQAIDIIENKALNKVNNLNNLTYAASLFNSLGNVYFAQAKRLQTQANSAKIRNAMITAEKFSKKATKNSKMALLNYENAFKLNQNNDNAPDQLKNLLNLIKLKQNFPDLPPIDYLQKKPLTLLNKISNSSDKIYAKINLAIPSPLSECPLVSSLSNSQIETQLNEAVENANQLKTSRVKSFALGALGHFYECERQYERALNLTQSALLLAEQNPGSDDSLYLWEWQLGRILEALKKPSEAINAYQRAYGILESLRSDILTANRDLQFDFRDTIEPLYRQLIQLMLTEESSSSNTLTRPIIKSLQTLDSLKLAELQNYLGDHCILTGSNETSTPQRLADRIFNKLENIDNDTALIIPIIFQDRLAILLSLPQEKLRVHWVNITQSQLTKDLELFWKQLQSFYDLSQSFKTSSQQFYDVLIRPFERDLHSAQIKTLVFILDGNLRNIPMAALHDGEQFLIEKYAIATTPSITLTPLTPSNLSDASVLAVGVAQESNIDQERYPALPNVETELKQIYANFPDSKLLLNQDFTRPNLQEEFKQNTYPIIHIATHGKFGTIPEDSFLVIGNNQKLTITDLEKDMRNFHENYNRLELLTLTACQTAIGDDRTTLGLAGITVQAGVKSTLASLWFIRDDYAETLITEFYNNLKTGISKAQSLQQAQKNLIKKGIHPGIWSPFILIGNWL
ncbi:CHAT domain-containing protein [Cyanothece sp. BG0011]|uniref:CHAT domain-containing protein n=1 Tax=Cyanothece sp. BG0011 TaxID=2082950 RepID=UPI000D1FAC31|nr:CHAT domain-containing protein [Cyanothece sp. BG0011]